jgi:colanic acid/amylovoran biosynthesis glycosyltransferase
VRLAVLANMQFGLEHFVYRELLFLAGHGYSISLFPTRFRHGLYNPRHDWAVHSWSAWKVCLSQPYFFLQTPFKYIALLREAITFRAISEFALAWYFSRTMADADVIYATFGDRKLFVAFFCKRILAKPLAVTTHAYELYANPNPRLFVRALDYCDQIITVTEYNRALLRDRYKIDPKRIEVVRYSVDLTDYTPTKKFTVLIVSYFTQRKGHDVLLKAVKALARENVEVWVVGDHSGRKNTVDVSSLASSLGLDSQVVFFGALGGNALKAIYRACDVFCLPCRMDSDGCGEGFPNVLIEAMACGKPIITTRHVEIPRIIPEIIVEENDVAGLAAAIERVYQSEPLRARLGHQNRKIAEHLFSPLNATKTAQLLRSLARPGVSQVGQSSRQPRDTRKDLIGRVTPHKRTRHITADAEPPIDGGS